MPKPKYPCVLNRKAFKDWLSRSGLSLYQLEFKSEHPIPYSYIRRWFRGVGVTPVSQDLLRANGAPEDIFQVRDENYRPAKLSMSSIADSIIGQGAKETARAFLWGFAVLGWMLVDGGAL